MPTTWSPTGPGTTGATRWTRRKIRAELGWEPRWTSFADGLAATVDWYKTHEAWWRPQKAATEAKYAKTGQ